MPLVAEGVIQLVLLPLAESFHETGNAQFPLYLSVIVCPGGVGLSSVDEKVRLVDETWSVQGGETVNATESSRGLFCTWEPGLLAVTLICAL